MNDASEFNHTVDLSRSIARDLIGEIPDHAEALRRWVNYVTDSPPRSWAPNIFAVSFSTEADLLSQWRGYATGYGGPFCLGFPFDQIASRVHDDWQLRKCEYARDRQEEILRERMRKGVQRANELGYVSEGKTMVDMEYAHLHGAVFNIAPTFKHPDFREEQEWRLYCGPRRIAVGGDVKFNVRPATIAPYVEFSLTDDGQPIHDLRWIAGPGPEQERTNLALGYVARIDGCLRYQGSPSQTPYQP